MKDPPRSLGAAWQATVRSRYGGVTLAVASVVSDVLVTIPTRQRAGWHRPPPDPIGTVGFAHGSGSGRFSPRNQRIAADVVRAGLATLLVDQLTEAEEAVDRKSEHLRVDLWLLADGSG